MHLGIYLMNNADHYLRSLQDSFRNFITIHIESSQKPIDFLEEIGMKVNIDHANPREARSKQKICFTSETIVFRKRNLFDQKT
jgi:pentose-5-phosphate-3-epimerase